MEERKVWLREKEALEIQLRQLGEPVITQQEPTAASLPPQPGATTPQKHLNLHDPSDSLETSMFKVGWEEGRKGGGAVGERE